MRVSLLLILLALVLTSCRHPQQPEDYDVGYNFLVVSDTLSLQEDMPMHLLIAPESAESLYVLKGDQVVVAQIETISEDEADSVWVKIARDQDTQGWIHESELLQGVIPDEPISHGIFFLSNAYLIPTAVLSLLVLVAWLIRRMRKERYHLVHIDDIPSPYPFTLCLCLSALAVLYASIKKFAPSTWAFFYFHPTLNPFGLPPLLALLLSLMWLILILFCASLMEISRCLRATEAVLYTLSLIAALAILYLVFSLATPCYIGYPLFVAYALAAFWQYTRKHRAKFTCGKCGARLRELGVCPKCGALNT